MNLGPKWFALSTRSRQEKVVLRQLQERTLEAFLPTVTRVSRWTDRVKRIDWPLFPGYCFVCVNGGGWQRAVSCAGAVRIVSFAGEPAPIPASEIEDIRQLIQSGLSYEPCPPLRQGQEITVLNGPLRGIHGRLLRYDTHRASVVLTVDLIGQAARVEVAASDVGAV